MRISRLGVIFFIIATLIFSNTTVPLPAHAAKATLSVSITSWSPKPTGDEISVTVKMSGATRWIARSDKWIEITPVAAAKSGSFKLKVGRSNTTTKKSTIVIVSSFNNAGKLILTKSIKVTQAGGGWVVVRNPTWNPNYKEQATAVTVATNWKSWSAKSNASWLTVTASGKPEAKATIKVANNSSTTKDRKATITFTAGYATQKFIVTQSKCPYAAKLTIISASTGGTSGHAFIMITNTTKERLKVAGYGIGAGESITVGTFGNKSDGKGVYFNLEAYKRYKTDRSLTKSLTAADVNKLSNYIKGRNYWTCAMNCAAFATNAWNQFVPPEKRLNGVEFPIPAFRPFALKNELARIEGNKKNISLPKVKKDTVKFLSKDETLKKVNNADLASASSESSGLEYCF